MLPDSPDQLINKIILLYQVAPGKAIGKEALVMILADAIIDNSLVTELVNLTKTVMGLFAEFPLNVMLIGTLCGVAFGLFRKARRSV